jgi:hypothetical protein
MSYYFPLGASTAIEKQNIDYAVSAITASVPSTKTITTITASYAETVANVPQQGNPGLSVTQFACELAAQQDPTLLRSGSQGIQGNTGSKGTDVTTCPAGTVRCVELEVSLSAAYNDGVTRGVNYYRPSGSQFSIVCMEILTGCSSIQALAGCPDYLRVTSPSII